jgi:uncharacterized protein
MLTFLAIGAVVGFAGGLFAIGGALIAIPVLTAAFAYSQHAAQGTAMPMALASACVTMIVYARKGLIRLREGLLMAACSTLAGFAASNLVRFIPDAALQRAFGFFLIALAILVWFGHFGERDAPISLPPYVQAAIGTFAGALSGLFVVGGALVTVPLLERLAQYSQQRAQAMVLLMLVPASAIGLVAYSSAGFVRWSAALPLALGAVALAPAGARVALAMQPKLLRRLFAVVQACAGILLAIAR